MAKLLIANRGEIAVRIAKAAKELKIPTVGIYSDDDVESKHVQVVTEAFPLGGQGPATYLHAQKIIEIAKEAEATLIHPGYGFLSENAEFAEACAEAGLTFVGPKSEILAELGNKVAARRLAEEAHVPIIPGISKPTTLEEVETFFDTFAHSNGGHGIVIKALAGGGGRGMRVITNKAAIEDAYIRCESEAEKAFGDGSLYVEKFLPSARHIEIQVAGDGKDVAHLWERDCSLQRRFQKLVEIAPAPGLPERMRGVLTEAALRMAQKIRLNSLATFEFLVDGNAYYFIEANPRLQVEHTVTEAVTGLDLVKTQIRLAENASLESLGLTHAEIFAPSGMAIQLRINLEAYDEEKVLRPTRGTITKYDFPAGSDVRVDGYGAVGYETNPRFDSLLAKLIVTAKDFESVLQSGYQHLSEIELEGVPTNIPFLKALLTNQNLTVKKLHTRFIDEHLDDLLLVTGAQAIKSPPAPEQAVEAVPELELNTNEHALVSPMPGSVVSISVEVDMTVQAGQEVAILEAMKMESVLSAPVSGIVSQILIEPGAIVATDQPILTISPAAVERQAIVTESETINLDDIRPDLAEIYDRRGYGLDENREDAVTKRHGRGGRTARENVADLCDPGSFVETGSANIAAQRQRRSLDDLIKRTPADGLVAGYGSVNGAWFDKETAQFLVMAYDYTVLAGTQGVLNHKKMDRLLHQAEKWPMPIILFAEGGGGRPGDVDYMGVAQLDVMTFALFARLTGKMPRVTIVNGYCFAGNAALAGCADVIIATENSSIGMGGPAMIEGGGLGSYHPRDVGPASFQATNGVIDVLVKDEAEGVAVAKKYLSYFQGKLGGWECADQRLLRQAIPENRRRIYDIRQLIETMADVDSVLELRSGFGLGMITALMRIEGRPLGVIANNPNHLGGAIDSDAADKAARFMQLCDAFGLPILSLVDTPGIMVGPDAEQTGTVRHASRLFVVGSTLRVPFVAIILRKGYGLGAQAMCAGSFHMPIATVAWPTGEFGAMGLEGAVQLGYRKELEQIDDPIAREERYQEMVAQAYANGKALNTASYMEIDEVIDPVETRARVISALDAARYRHSGENRRIDTW